MKWNKIKTWLLLLVLSIVLVVPACSTEDMNTGSEESISLSEIPEFNGDPFVAINDNMPEFTEEDLSSDAFESYSELDELGRCQTAFANIGRELMPTDERGNISQIKPTGWHSVKYDNVDGKSLYNRCHLIGWQLTGENANERNLITGTRYMNVDGMLPFENMIADYIKETDNHVLYRVTPIFEGDDLVARGVQMEAYSIEDDGDGVCFNVFAYNNQPGIAIDYATGESWADDADHETEAVVTEGEIRGNKNSKVYHCPGQAAYEEMKDSKNLIIFDSEEAAQEAGYRKAKR